MAAMTPTTKCLALAALGAILAQVSYARTPAQAHSQVRSWVASHPNAFGRTLHRPSGVVLTAKKLGTNIFHSVSLESGGFAVVADSDGVLLAFSEEGTFSQTNAAPLWAMLLANTGAVVPERRRGPRLLSQAEISTTTLPEGISVAETTVAATAPKLMASTKISSTSSISDLRVPPQLKSKWGQSTNNGKRIYNYYTPYNSVCGCVATAMSQIMRYHEYPTSKVTAETKACCYDGAVTNLTMQGGTYNWSEMPLVPSSSISISQQQAIGKLTSDAGISVHMQYTKNSSGAFSIVAAYALTNIWKYAQSQYWCVDEDNPKLDDESRDGYVPSEVVENTILANLDAGYPSLLGISGNNGHAVVADGYGYVDSQRYVHLNLGWDGSSDAWYYFPISAGGHTFKFLCDIIYNLFPTNIGNIISGRITAANGTAIAGASIGWQGYKETARFLGITRTAISGETFTSDSGIYSFIVPNATVAITNLTVSLTGYEPSSTNCIATTSTVSYFSRESDIPSNPAEGSLTIHSTSAQNIGNSWGNDLTLKAYYVEPSFGATPALSATDGSLSLVTSATAGTKWIIQWNDNLANSGGWTDIYTFTATGLTQPIEIDSTVFDWRNMPSAFFRLAPAD